MTTEELKIKLKEFKDKYYRNGRVISTDITFLRGMHNDFDEIFKDIKVWDLTSTEPFILYRRTDSKIFLHNSTNYLVIQI